jgi:hypothetical protein
VTDKALNRQSVVGRGSIYPTAQNLLLAARNEGLGCVLTTLFCVELLVERLLDQWTPCRFPDWENRLVCSKRWITARNDCLAKFGPVGPKPVDEIMRFDRWF